jgi:cytochrome c oxidase subunit 4
MAETLDHKSSNPHGAAVHEIGGVHEHVDPLKSYIAVFVALLLLLVLTVGVYQVDMGVMNTVIALLIASCKGLLVMLVFMHLRHGTKLTWVIAGVGFVFLSIMITFTFADYLSRNAIPEQVKEPGPMADMVVHHEQLAVDKSTLAP